MLSAADPGTRARREAGFVLVLWLLALALLAAGALFARGADSERGDAYRDPAALHTATRALIAYAATVDTDPARPGALLCPDHTGNGIADNIYCFNPGGPRPVYQHRLPARTLDLPHRRAGSDDGLWYAIDGRYRDLPNARPFNPGRNGALELDGRGGYVAVVVDPGPPLPRQDGRPSERAGDYLECANADDDALAFRDYGHARAGTGCNDRVRGIHVDALFDPVQRRVLRAVERALRAYHAEQGVLPRPAALGDAGGACEPDTFIGHLPLAEPEADPAGCAADERLRPAHFGADWEWLSANEWFPFIVYHVAAGCTAAGGTCPGATPRLNGTDGLMAVVAAAGRALPGQRRERAQPSLDDYLNLPADHERGEYVDRPLLPGANDAFRGIDPP